MAEVKNAGTLAVCVTSELHVPRLSYDEESGEPGQRLISLGLFSKISGRLPNLQAFDGSGRQLSVLGRAERYKALTEVLTGRFKVGGPVFPTEAADQMNVAFDRLRLPTQRRLFSFISEIVDDEPRRAKARAQALKVWMDRNGLAYLAGMKEFKELLATVVDDTHLLVFVDAQPDDDIVLTIKYELPVEPFSVRREFALGDRRKAVASPSWWWEESSIPRQGAVTLTFPVVLRPIRSMLRFVGLVPLPMAVEEPSAEHCESMYFTVEPMQGTEVEDIYWEAKENAPSKVSTGTDYQRGDQAVLSNHTDDGKGHVASPPKLWFGLRVARWGSAPTAAVICLTIAYTMWKVAEGDLTLGDTNEVGAALTLAIPGFAAGAASLLGGASKSRVTLGPWLLLLVTGSLPYVTVMQSLTSNSESVTSLARFGAAFSAGVCGLFLAIFIGPLRPSARWLSDKGNGRRRRRFYAIRDTVAALEVGACVLVSVLIWIALP